MFGIVFTLSPPTQGATLNPNSTVYRPVHVSKSQPLSLLFVYVLRQTKSFRALVYRLVEHGP